MSIKYIYMVIEAVDDFWEAKAVCMLRGNADKLLDDLRVLNDDIHSFYLFRVPQDRVFKYPIVGKVTDQDELLRNGCLTLEVDEQPPDGAIDSAVYGDDRSVSHEGK